jgi:hypothetical protein
MTAQVDRCPARLDDRFEHRDHISLPRQPVDQLAVEGETAKAKPETSRRQRPAENPNSEQQS